jgi:hypothetical protein
VSNRQKRAAGFSKGKKVTFDPHQQKMISQPVNYWQHQ